MSASAENGGAAKKAWRSVVAFLKRTLAIFIFFAVWEALPRSGIIDPFFLPPLSVVIRTIYGMVVDGELFTHLAASLKRTLTGFTLGFLVSVSLGLMIGWFRPMEKFLDPLLQAFRQTSALALFPVFILFFGIGETAKIAIIYWGVQWPILLNTTAGVKNVDPLLIKAARSMAASNLTIFFRVVLPASLPYIFTGARLSATTSILILIAAEMVGAKAGLGFLVFDAQQKFEIPRMYAGILLMSLLGFTANYLILSLERRYTSWKRNLLPQN
ncbi:MAG: ABC transporter permease [Synergistaceae bacterium]|jgi:NitT/TauT family transport system permease protein|nr:ABC transporter permease [Synergistaceae bacterium]